METTAVSQASLFWNNLGKWQVIAIVLSLASFFITLHFTRDNKLAGFSIYAISMIFMIIFFTSGGGAVIVSGFNLVFLGLFITPICRHFFLALIASALLLAVFLSVGVRAFIEDAEEMELGIRRRDAFLSSTVEFVIVLLPMLLVH